ncbi:MAG: acyl-CoA synthetase, partial [Acidimicrobiia bacterium]
HYIEATFAAHKLRAVPINVNYRYVEEELRYLFDNADLKALVHGREYTPRIARVAADCPQLTSYVAVEDGSDCDLQPINAVSYEDALAAQPATRNFAPRSADDLYILYTGGTTGMPKGVMWRSEDFLFSTILPLMTLGGPLPESPAEVFATAREKGGSLTTFPIAPLMHGAANWVAMMALFSGNKLALVPSPRLDPDDVWRTVEAEHVNSITVVGDAMARPLIESLEANPGKYDVSSLFAMGSGGAILSPAVKAKIHEILPDLLILDSHGASESGYQGGAIGADDEGHPRFNMGPDTTVLDEHGRPMEPGTGVAGRLARRGHVPVGYYKDEAKTKATFIEVDGERWALPGDMAILEADGIITLLGRGSVSINTGGEKVYPEEVEMTLKSHPDVFDAVVVGVPDERWGERVAAVVTVRPGAAVSLDELRAHCQAQIAGYKAPRELKVVDELVRSPSGKADYRWAKSVALGNT